MKIAVCIKQVVTREWQLRVNDQMATEEALDGQYLYEGDFE